jgi:hypothetical protein
MDKRLNRLIESLRLLARQPDAEELGLVKAGLLIDEHLEGIREAFAASQRKFWDGVQEFVSLRLPE